MSYSREYSTFWCKMVVSCQGARSRSPRGRARWRPFVESLTETVRRSRAAREAAEEDRLAQGVEAEEGRLVEAEEGRLVEDKVEAEEGRLVEGVEAEEGRLAAEARPFEGIPKEEVKEEVKEEAKAQPSSLPDVVPPTWSATYFETIAG